MTTHDDPSREATHYTFRAILRDSTMVECRYRVDTYERTMRRFGNLTTAAWADIRDVAAAVGYYLTHSQPNLDQSMRDDIQARWLARLALRLAKDTPHLMGTLGDVFPHVPFLHDVWTLDGGPRHGEQCPAPMRLSGEPPIVIVPPQFTGALWDNDGNETVLKAGAYAINSEHDVEDRILRWQGYGA